MFLFTGISFMLRLSGMARAKSNEGKVNARLPRSLSSEFRGWIGAHGNRFAYFNRRIGIEPLIGALIQDFLLLPASNQAEMLNRALPMLEQKERAEQPEQPDLIDSVANLEPRSGPGRAVHESGSKNDSTDITRPRPSRTKR
jgi:hypothetical protein